MVLVRHQAGSTTLSVTATRRGSTVMPHYTLLCSVGDIKSPPRLTQFTGRLCKKTAQAVGDAEAVKSSVLRCLSSGNPVVTGASPSSQVGGLNSPASQPSASEAIGSCDTTVVSTRPHFWHSNVR